MSKLTPKQEGFCLSYIETGNASEAYRRNYNAENMAEATINSRAYELLQNGEITVRSRWDHGGITVGSRWQSRWDHGGTTSV